MRYPPHVYMTTNTTPPRQLTPRNVTYVNVYPNPTYQTTQCLHKSCFNCQGTGTRVDGSSCIHNLACNCPNCTIR